MDPENPENSGNFEVVPASLFLPGALIPHQAMLESAAGKGGRIRRDEYLTRGLNTRTTSVSEAAEHAETLLRECKRRLEQGRDASTIWKLLNDYPELIANPWVRAKLRKLAECGRLSRPRGRPGGSFTIHPLLVMGLMRECVAAGIVKNGHQAFDWVSEKLACLSPDQAKQLYYQAENDSRFRAVLVERSDRARPATVEEIAKWQAMEPLRPGQRFTQTFEDPVLGTVQLTIEAKD